MKISFYTGDEVKRTLTMPLAISAMRDAFTQHGLNKINMPVRSALNIAAQDAVTLCMPAHLQASEALGVKVVSVFPKNTEKNLPTVNAIMILLNGETGVPLAIIDGTSLTGLRTGAVSGLATDLLARTDASVLAMVGTGAQAAYQIEAVCAVRPIRRINIFSRNHKNAQAFAASLNYENITVCATAEEATTNADVICTATTSQKAILDSQMIKPGAHINAVGSFKPDMHELSGDLLAAGKVFIDERESSLAEAGEIITALARNQIQKEALTELGEVLSGRKNGRESSRQITVFKSVGLAIQDVAAAALLHTLSTH